MATSIQSTQVDARGIPDTSVGIQQADALQVPASLPKDLISVTKYEKTLGNNFAKSNVPEIDTPVMDPDTAIVLLMNVTDKLNKSDIKNSYLALKVKNEFKNKVGQEKINLMIDNIKKAEEEKRKQKEQGIANDIGLGMGSAAAILGFIGALIFTLATGGAGVPALIAAGVGLGMASLDAGTRIATAVGATYTDAKGEKQALDITLGGMVKRITEQLAHDDANFPLGSTKENREQKLAEYVMGFSVFLNIVVAAATIAVSAVSLRAVIKSGADIAKATTDIAKATSDTAKSAATVMSQNARFASSLAHIAQVVTEMTEAASMVTSGAFGAQLAVITSDMKEVDNKKSETNNFLKLLADEISTNQGFLTYLIERSEERYESIASTLSNYYQSQSKTKLSI